jgi:hypothetical protein
MSNAVPPLPPDEVEEEAKPGSKNRAWVWVLLWLGCFLVLPGVFVGWMQQQRAREFAASLKPVSKQMVAVAPPWIPLRGDYRVQESKREGGSGSAVLLASQTVEAASADLKGRFQAAGFDVSSNLMRRDEEVSTEILNASQPAEGRFALITLSKSAFGTRVDLSYSEKK